MGIRTAVQSLTRCETRFYFGRDALPERKSCSGMSWDQGGSTPGAEVAAGSSGLVELFVFFCQGLGSLSQNNHLCCPLVCHHRHLVQQRAELPPQHNSAGDLFREKAGPLSWVWESCCVLASFFLGSFPFHLKKPALPQIPAPASKWMCYFRIFFNRILWQDKNVYFLKSLN